jgi:hypothetical protein
MAAAILLPVFDRQQGEAVELQPWEDQLLEVGQDFLHLGVSRAILEVPVKHQGGVLGLEAQAVGHLGHHHRVALDHLDPGTLFFLAVDFRQQVIDGIHRRAHAAIDPSNNHLMPLIFLISLRQSAMS